MQDVVSDVGDAAQTKQVDSSVFSRQVLTVPYVHDVIGGSGGSVEQQLVAVLDSHDTHVQLVQTVVVVNSVVMLVGH